MVDRRTHHDLGLLPLPAWEEQQLPPFPGDYVAAAGTRVFVRRTPAEVAAPDAPTGMFVHGLGSSALHWTDLMHVLSGRLRGVALDLPGCGFSDPAAHGAYGPGAHADAVIGVIEAEGAVPVHLIGNSLGGSVATVVAARRPDLVASLMLISPAVPFYRPRRYHLVLAAGIASPVASQAKAHLQRSGIDVGELQASVTQSMMFTTPEGLHPQRKREEAAEAQRLSQVPWADQAFSRSLRALLVRFGPGSSNLWSQARLVQAPTLVMLGRQDRLIDVNLAGRISRTYRNSRVVVDSQHGHVPHMEHPMQTATLIAEWLDQIAAPG